MPPVPPQLDEHGFPIPTTFDGQPIHRGPSRTFQFIWRAGLVLAFLAVLVGVLSQSPLAGFVKEKLAERLIERAREKERLGDLRGALADLSGAATWSPDNATVLELRAQLKLTMRDVEGSLEDCNALVKLDRRYAPAYIVRSAALQRLDRHREAIDDLTEAIRLSDSRDALPRNNRAYARAVAGIDLPEALDDVEQAIAIVDEDLAHERLALRRYSFIKIPQLKSQKAAYLDTRGYIYFLQGRPDDALADLKEAIQLENEFRAFVLEQAPAKFQPYWERRLNQGLAVMHHHRGQVYEKLGRQDESRSDLDLATQLGYNPAEGVF